VSPAAAPLTPSVFITVICFPPPHCLVRLRSGGTCAW
jgi:hypothetical protein